MMSLNIKPKLTTISYPLRSSNHRMAINRVYCSTGTPPPNDDSNKVSFRRRIRYRYESKPNSLFVEMDDSVYFTSDPTARAPQPASNNTTASAGPSAPTTSPTASTAPKGLYDKIESQLVKVFLSEKAFVLFKDFVLYVALGSLFLFVVPVFAGALLRKKSASEWAPAVMKAISQWVARCFKAFGI